MKIRSANEQDLAEIAGWFSTETEAKNWGGPSIHFPVILEQLKIDIQWDVADSYALIDESGNLLGFAQAFNKYGYKHLGRIAISPEMRGEKLGHKLMTALLNSIGNDDLSFSLFVHQDNIPAKNLYDSLGFEIQPYPEGKPEVKDSLFMVKKNTQQILLRDGRRLSYAEYGDPQGAPIFLFHGIPGSRFLRHPDDSLTRACNVRLIVPDRPGMGCSDFKPGRTVLDWPADVQDLADTLGIERFSVAGFSGGGPYAAACGFAIPHRLKNVGLISGVGPTDAPDVLVGMLSSNRMGYKVGRWMPWIFWRFIFNFYYRDICHHPEKLAKMTEEEPAADQAIFIETGIQQILIKTFAEAFRQGTLGAARDGWLLARPWEFKLMDISVPVFLWQGEADVVVTPAMGKYMAARIPRCYARFLPGEGHLMFITNWQEILSALTN